MVAGLASAVIALGCLDALADEAPSPAGDRRIPWTTSRLKGTPDAPPPYLAEPAFSRLRFDRPVVLTAEPGARRLWIGEVGGKLFSFPEDPEAETADLALDLARLRPGFSALYGIAFHPRFAENRSVFLCYVVQNDRPDGTRVSRFQVSRTDPPRIVPESEQVLITWLSGGHNGGCLAFGPDGMLYISAGDAGPASPPDPLRTGQDLGDLLSSILRIDVNATDPGKPYRVPPDNPFVGVAGARPEIWAYGLRNPWKMSFDPGTGDLWVGDVGWELWELVDRIERGGNYGWSVMEGRQPVRPEGERGPSPILPPTIDHPHSEAASITGGYVYRGDRLKDLAGVYVYGDYQSGKVWGLRHDGRKVTWRGELADTGLRLVAFGEGSKGELYLVEHERTNQVYRLVPNTTSRLDADFPRTLGQTGLFASTADHAPAPGVFPYTINASAWADGTSAERLLAIPGDARIDLDDQGRWRLPEGSVLAKTIALDLVAGDPRSRRRLETQVLHLEAGSWRPYTYFWNDEQTDATLAGPEGASRTLTVRDEGAPGGHREQDYRFSGRSECVLCHNPWVEARTTVFGRQSASPVALNAAQLDRDGSGRSTGPLRRLEQLGYFTRPVPSGKAARLTDPYDVSADLDARARSYLQVNCAHCHQLGAGGSAYIDLAYSTRIGQTRTIGVPPMQGAFGIDDARIIAPGAPERSVLFYRIAKTGAGRMPRLGSRRVDEAAVRLIADWIARMPQGSPDPMAARDAALMASLREPATDRPVALRPCADSTRSALALIRRIAQDGFPEPARRELVALGKNAHRAEVRDLFERFVPDSERVKRLGDSIDPEAILALTGDAARGRRWYFEGSETACKSCHRVGTGGNDLGPPLDAIGSKYSKRELLGQIVEPSREIDPKYAAHAVATRAGQVHVGLLVEKTELAVVLRDAQDRTIRILAADIEQHVTQPVSLMPQGLLRELTAQQAADLLEFLASLKGR
jgi:putative heme-binding domain-containing protein